VNQLDIDTPDPTWNARRELEVKQLDVEDLPEL